MHLVITHRTCDDIFTRTAALTPFFSSFQHRVCTCVLYTEVKAGYLLYGDEDGKWSLQGHPAYTANNTAGSNTLPAYLATGIDEAIAMYSSRGSTWRIDRGY